ncbi:MAG: hypothetical protein V1873_06605 [Verrucomicrobiota bacterium]
MQRILTVVVIGGLLAGFCVAAEPEEAVAKPAPARAVALVAVGPVDETLARKVGDFVQQDIRLPVRLLPPQKAVGGTLDAEGEAAAKLMGEGDVCLVALVSPAEDIAAHGVGLSAQHVAALNVKALQPADGDQEKLARRLEKETMRSIGSLLGMSSCPNPQCVMWVHSTLDEMDAKSRSFCPPCLEKVRNAATANGIMLIPMTVGAMP